MTRVKGVDPVKGVSGYFFCDDFRTVESCEEDRVVCGRVKSLCYFGATAGWPDDSMAGTPGTDQSERRGSVCVV